MILYFYFFKFIMDLIMINDENKNIVIEEKHTEKIINIKDIDAGSKNIRLNIIVKGDFSSVLVNIILETKNKDYKKIDVSFSLKGRNQKGEIIVKGIANHQSQIECNASGIISKESSNCIANIHEKFFLFSENSKIKAIPQLKVETENLESASHSASVSSIPEDIYFFLAAKGLNKNESYEILRYGILDLELLE
jgi:Fe-S cluster assembly scaffold protein SufB